MNQTELIARFKQIEEEHQIARYAKPSRYFKTVTEHYKDVQDGIASELNFFENTIAIFKETEKPNREPDFTSDSGSQYWYYKDKVIRGSNHWGRRVDNCDWALQLSDGHTQYGTMAHRYYRYLHYKYGECKWQDFTLKAYLCKINGQEVLTTFNNTEGRNCVIVDGKKYEKVIVEEWKEIEE